MSEPDYPMMLNNKLQGHPSGNMTSFLRYKFEQEGPDHSAIHTATAVFCDLDYGVGRGTSRAKAKKAAAKATLEQFMTNGVPGASG